MVSDSNCYVPPETCDNKKKCFSLYLFQVILESTAQNTLFV